MRAMLSRRIAVSVSVLTLTAWSLVQQGRVQARQGAATTRTAQGENLAKTARHKFEVFFYTTGLRVFPFDAAGGPIDVAKLGGTATFYHPNSSKPWFSRSLRVGTNTPGQAQRSLDVVIDLATVPPTGSKVVFEVTGLTDSTEPSALFTVPVSFVTASVESVAGLPAAPARAAAPSPRYVYGPGYYGYGYYIYPGPEVAPAQSVGPAVYGYGTSSPHGSSSDTVGPGHRDWSTGRSNGLAKPWMRAMD